VVKGSIVFKVIGTIVGLLIVFFGIYTYVYINQAKRVFDELEQNKAVSLVQTLDANISSADDLNDVHKLQVYINKLMWVNPDLIRVSINLPTETGLRVVASNADQEIGQLSSENNQKAIREDSLISGYDTIESSRALIIISPLHVAGQTVGTYEMTLSLAKVDVIISQWEVRLLIANAMAIIILFFLTYLIIRIVIFNPIRQLSKGMEYVGEGNLDYSVHATADDEIGRLGVLFNTMTRRLKEYKDKIEGYSHLLEQQVETKTEELHEKESELETKKVEMEKMNEMLKERSKKMAELVEKTKEEIARQESAIKNPMVDETFNKDSRG